MKNMLLPPSSSEHLCCFRLQTPVAEAYEKVKSACAVCSSCSLAEVTCKAGGTLGFCVFREGQGVLKKVVHSLKLTASTFSKRRGFSDGFPFKMASFQVLLLLVSGRVADVYLKGM